MSVTLYWKERLDAQNPLYDELLRIDKVNIRPKPGMDPRASWPHAVARNALYQDYVNWHRKVFLEQYRAVEFYRLNPARMPRPVGELVFFSTMAPWVYVVGKKEQVRTYSVPSQERFEDRWIDMKANVYFTRLLEWKYHVAAFELETGQKVQDSPCEPGSHVAMLTEIRTNYIAQAEANRTKFGGRKPEAVCEGA